MSWFVERALRVSVEKGLGLIGKSVGAWCEMGLFFGNGYKMGFDLGFDDWGFGWGEVGQRVGIDLGKWGVGIYI